MEVARSIRANGTISDLQRVFEHTGGYSKGGIMLKTGDRATVVRKGRKQIVYVTSPLWQKTAWYRRKKLVGYSVRFMNGNQGVFLPEELEVM
jgi:hypothetical protein